MITTSIITGIENGCPVWHKSEGFAKNESVAQWLFAYCGWKSNQSGSELLVCEEVIEWVESDQYFPCNMTEFWVLGSCLHLS